MEDPFLNYLALGLVFFVVIVLFYDIIAIHDIPALIAKRRHHLHQNAIHAADWSVCSAARVVAVSLDLAHGLPAGTRLGFSSQAGRAGLAAAFQQNVLQRAVPGDEAEKP